MAFVLFFTSVLVLTVLIILYRFGSFEVAFEYLKAKPGITKGIIIFVVAALIAGLAFQRANAGWLEYTEIYIGIDQPRNNSPMCEKDGFDQKLTSNGGIRQNIYRTDDDLFHFNFKYTHHSCAFNSDRETYDAFGFESTYRIEWE